MSIHRRPLLVAAAACFVLFWVLAYFTTAGQLSEIIRSVQIPVSIAVAIAYAPDAWGAVMGRKPGGVGQLVVGIVCSWVGFIGVASWGLLFRLADQPQWMLSSDFPNMFSALATFGACLHITAPGAMNGVPRRSAVWLGVAGGFAATCVVSFVVAHPNMRAVTDQMRPYLEDRRTQRLFDQQLFEEQRQFDPHKRFWL